MFLAEPAYLPVILAKTGIQTNLGDMVRMTSESSNAPSISERVRFWEEQNRINQELIPRVIRQHELLTAHIADHENLPLIAGNAISEALAAAREEQQQQHETELAAVKAEGEEQHRRHQAELEAAKAERQEQNRHHQEDIAALQEQVRKMRNLLIGAATGATAISIAAIIFAIIT
jgi:hypothetical protein